MLIRQVHFFNLQPSKTLAFQGYFCHGGARSKQQVTVLLACNGDGSDKLSLVIRKYKGPCCFKNDKGLLAKYEANINSWMTIKLSEDYLTQLDSNMGPKNRKTFLFIDHCAAHLRNTIFLCNIIVVFLPAKCTSQPQPLDFEVMHAFPHAIREST
jgi:hypothetical protein